MHHFLNVDDVTREEIDEIFRLVPAMQQGFSVAPKCDKIMATLFFEPSTRTKLSFHSAMYRLGGNVIDLPTNSSQKKGETDIDTVKTISQYADVLVIRHPKECLEELAAASSVPIISAGEANFHHPTQALLDLYTIRQHCGNKKEITIMFTGDLFYSRTVPSLVSLLERERYFVKFLFANQVHPSLKWSNRPAYNYINETIIPEVISHVDVLYMTRPQKERWLENMDGISDFVLTKDLVHRMKADAIIMHPLPRNEELPPEIDDNYRAKYFQQVKNGLHIRMALLRHLLWK